jgi:hypothetical protein
MLPESRNLRSIDWYQKTYIKIPWDYPFKYCTFVMYLIWRHKTKNFHFCSI